MLYDSKSYLNYICYKLGIGKQNLIYKAKKKIYTVCDQIFQKK